MAVKNPYGIYPHFYKRNASQPLPMPHATFSPTAYSFNEIGGPKQATIKAVGDDGDIAELFDLIGCPIELRDVNGEPRWWGIVVSVSAGPEGVSLDDMANSISVVYSAKDLNGASTAAKTSAAQDSDSISEYGTFELLKTASNATATSAAAMATAALAVKKYPPVRTEIGGSGDGTATLTCRGMFDMLKRRYYSAAAIGASSTVPASGTTTADARNVGYGIEPALTEDADFKIGNATATTKIEFTFTLPGYQTQLLKTLRMKGVKTGAPTDDLTVSIYSDASGALSVLMGTANVTNASISGTANAVFDVAMDQGTTKIWCVPGVTYHAEVKRNGSIDAVNYFSVHGKLALGNAGSVTRVWNGSAWVARSPDADVFFLINSEATECSYDLLGTASHERMAVSFQLGGSQNAAATPLTATLAKVGSPSGNVTGFLCADSGGAPGTVIDYINVPCSSISTTSGQIAFNLTLNTLNAPTDVLWFQLWPTYTANGSDYIRVVIDPNASYTGGSTKYYNSSSWGALPFTGQMLFEATGAIETTTQIVSIIAANSQFIASAEIGNVSGVFTSPYRDGNTTCWQIITELLAAGTSSGAALLASVTRDFILRLYSDPGTSDINDYYIDRRLNIATRLGVPTDKSLCPIGWYRRRDSLAAISANSRLLNASVYAVAEAEYNCDADTIRLTARGARDPFSISTRDG